MEWFHPYRKWWDAGITIGGGSDHMIRTDPLNSTNPWDPWLGIWIAVTRQGRGDRAAQPRSEADARTRPCVSTPSTTRGCTHEEAEKGSIEPGKLADLILVDRDPLTCPEDSLRSTVVLSTLVGGRTVYTATSGPAAVRGAESP